MLAKYGATTMITQSSLGYKRLKSLYMQDKPLLYEGVIYKAKHSPELIFLPARISPKYDSDPEKKVRQLQYGFDTD